MNKWYNNLLQIKEEKEFQETYFSWLPLTKFILDEIVDLELSYWNPEGEKVNGSLESCCYIGVAEGSLSGTVRCGYKLVTRVAVRDSKFKTV